MKPKRILAFILSLVMMLSLLPTFTLTASAETEDVEYRWYFSNGKGWGTRTRTATKLTSDSTTWTTTTTDGFYYAEGNVTINSRVTVNGSVVLILKDGCNLTINGGISVNSGNTLEIYSQEQKKGTGALKANAGGNQENAVIGGNDGSANGTVTIHGGNITAENNKNGAGIGGGNDSGGGTITIHSGTITTGNTANMTRGAGIGGGRGGNSGTITIYGGTINAKSTNGAGIGGGSQVYYKDGGHCETVNIYGGTITATADRGAGIGGGEQGRGGAVKIENATVTVTSKNGYGIGGGFKVDDSNKGTTTIKNSLVRATGRDTNHITGGTYSDSLVFTGKEGKVYGTYTLGNDFTLDGGSTLNIDNGNTLNLGSGKTIAVKGNMKVDGTLGGSGGTIDLTGGGTVSGNVGITLATPHNLKFNVDYRLTNLKVGRTSPHTLASSQIAYDDTFDVTNNGYKLPETITVDGATDFTYENGYINIRKDKIQKNLTITASAVPRDFTVTLVANGGKIAEGKDVTGYTYGTAVDLPAKSDMTRTGYEFYGWKSEKNLNGANFTKISNTESGDKTYYAKWTPNEYKVCYVGNGETGGSMNDTEHVYDAEQALSKNAFKKEGCVFGHWNTKADGNGTSFADEQKVKNLTDRKGYVVKLYAQWLERVTFDVTNTEHVYKNGTAREITLVPKSSSNALSADDFTVKYYRVDENNDTVSTTPVKKSIESGTYLYVIDFANDDLKKTYSIENQYSVTDDEIPNVDEHDNIGFMYINATIEQQEPISFDEGEASLKVGEDYQNTLKNPNTGSTVTYSSSNTDIAEVAADGKVTAKKAGTVTITAKSEKKDCTTVYTSYKLTIKKELSASDFVITSAEKTYDGTTEATVTATISESSLSDATDIVKATVTAVYDNANCGEDKTVTWTVTGLSGRNSDKYILAESVKGTTKNNKINPANVSIICSETTTRTYDGNPQVVDVSAMANGKVFAGENFTVMYKKSDESNASATPPKAVGEYTISIELKDAYKSNYEVVQPNAKLIIKSAKQDIFSIEIDRDVVYYGDTFELSNSGANGTVTYSVTGEDGNATDIATLNADGKTVTANKTGKIVITAESELAGYDKRTATKTIEIRKRVLTPSVTATNKTYDGTNAVTVSVTLKNIVNSDDVTASATGTMLNADAGKDKIVYVSGITLSEDKKDYYTLSTSSLQTSVDIEKRKITSFTFESEDKTYDKTDVAVAKNIVFEEATTGKSTGVLSADDGQITLIGSVKYENATDGNAGSYYVSYTASGLTGTKAHNYELDLSDNMKTNEKYEIEKMDVEFSIGQTTFVYDGNKKEISVSAKDEKGNNFTEFEISYNKDPINVGDDYTATIEIKNGNYKTSQETVKITIEKADQNNLVITDLPGTVQYKQNDIVLKAVGGVDSKDATYKWTSDNENVTFDDDESATPKIIINGAVGERVEITVTKTVSNYSDISASTAFVPTAKSVVFDITNLEQTYKDGKTVKITPNDSDVTQSDYTVTYNGKDTAPTNAGTYVVKVEAKGNYTGTQTATLVIGKASLKGDIEFVYEDGKTKYVYGDKVSAKATNVTQDDNDEITAKITYVGTGIYVEQTEAPKKAGNYAVKLTISGRNYETLTKAEEFVIEKAPLKVWVDNVSRPYGEANPVFTINYDGFVNSEDKSVLLVEPVATTMANASSPVKDYDIVVSGGSAENYQFDYVTGEGKNTLTVEGATGGNLYITGASGTVGVGQIFTLSAFYGNTKIDVKWSSSDPDVVSIDEKTGVVTAKKASSKTVTITATADENYGNKTATFDLNVEKASVILTAKDTVKTYNGEEQYITIISSNPNFVPSASNVEVTYTLTTNSEVHSPKNVGTYAVNFVITDDSYTGGGNATMYINKATVTAKVKDDTKVYGDEYTGYDIEITNNGGITNETALAEVITNIKSATSFASDGAAKTAGVKEGGYEMIPTLSSTETDNVKFTVDKGTLTVNKAPLTIKVKDVSREYGAENPALEVEYTGFKNEETKEILSGELVLAYDESINAETAVGTYEDKTTASGVTADNYEITFEQGDVEITKIAVNASAGTSRASYLTVKFDKAVEGVTFKVTDANGDVEVTSVTASSDNKTYTLNGTFTVGTEYTVEIAYDNATQDISNKTLKITPTKQSSGGGGGGGSSATTSYTVTFETNGGSKVDSVKVEKNKTVSEPTAPTKDGFEFDGWYSDKKLTTAYDFDTKVTKAITLYAKWTEKKVDDNKDDNNKPTPSEWKNPFTDVTKADWFFDNVRYANENGLMSGTTDTTFAPNDNLTRGMLVTVLYRAEGEPAVNKSIPFADVNVSQYYANAVIWAEQNGIVKGVSETEFAPDENITREQIATIIYRYAEYKGIAPTGAWAIKLDYADVSDISDYAVEGVMYCTMKNIMQGKDNNMFAPKDNATRAEIAAILNRFIEGNK